ncbi:MAG: ADP-glyceromanno-heptose 6-epimerase [Verrucomicrobia bacterium]|nr:MAG: ADP-glyceromanno-heptose 6-epimerase [Verrucomicrobiota bacterium]
MHEKIIVTGGAGFIGCNLIAELNRRGRSDILIVDELGADGRKWKNLVGLRFSDYLHKDRFRTLLASGPLPSPDVVFHLGACSVTTESDADYLADNNFAFSKELCTWTLRKGARFIYASSAATYGDRSQGYSDALEVLPRLRPLNMYAFSKHMFDLWAKERGLFQLIVGLKYFNVYGPHEEHKGEMRSVVHKAFEQIMETGRVRLFRSYRPDYRDGEQKRDFIYVKDAVKVTLFFMDHANISGLFNCGTGLARTWNDLARAVFDALGRKPRIEYIEMPPGLSARYQYHTEADITRLRQAGYRDDFMSLEDGIRDYVHSYLLPNRSE